MKLLKCTLIASLILRFAVISSAAAFCQGDTHNKTCSAKTVSTHSRHVVSHKDVFPGHAPLIAGNDEGNCCSHPELLSCGLNINAFLYKMLVPAFGVKYFAGIKAEKPFVDFTNVKFPLSAPQRLFSSHHSYLETGSLLI